MVGARINESKIYEQLTYDFCPLTDFSNHPAVAAELFESRKFCEECERRVFDWYINNTGQICVRIKCTRCGKVVSIPIITLT